MNAKGRMGAAVLSGYVERELHHIDMSCEDHRCPRARRATPSIRRMEVSAPASFNSRTHRGPTARLALRHLSDALNQRWYMQSLIKKCAAESLGTFWLVLGGCGSAVLAAQAGGDFNPLGLGYLGVSLAFGVAVATAAFAFGPVSGGHFNPAVSFGLWIAGRFSGRQLPAYVVAQVLGGLAAGALMWTIVTASPDFLPFAGAGTFATNGFEDFSPGGYPLEVAFLAEAVLTAVFLYVILAVTRPGAVAGWAPLAIGATLALIHMISIPLTNTSVNPARSTGVAAFVGESAGYMPLHQLWLFWLAPCVGALIGALVYRAVNSEKAEAA